jgi:hypothetical protein
MDVCLFLNVVRCQVGRSLPDEADPSSRGVLPTVTECDLETSRMRRPGLALGCCAQEKEMSSRELDLFVFIDRSEWRQEDSSTVLEVLQMLPALINFRDIDVQKAKEVQNVLFDAGYKVADLMLQVSYLSYNTLML